MKNVLLFLKSIAIFALLLVPILAFAQELAYEKFNYTVNEDNTITIAKYTGSREEKVIIPEKIDGKSVTVIGKRAFEFKDDMHSVTIPKTVVSIEDYAFHQAALYTLFMPNSVKYIGDGAFSSCKDLQYIVFESGDDIIFGSSILQGTSALETIKDENGNMLGNDEYFVRNNTIMYYLGIVTRQERRVIISLTGESVREYAIKTRSEPEEVTIPEKINGESITAIGNNAFRGKNRILKLTIPDTIIAIGKSAFAACTRLTDIRLPQNITKIEDQTFSGCIKLTSINLPKSITSIGNRAFAGCEMLTSMIIPDGVESLGDQIMWGCYKLEKIIIPRTVTSVGDNMFERALNLAEIVDENGEEFGDKDFMAINGTIVKCLAYETNLPIPEQIYDMNIFKLIIPDQIDGVDIVKIAGGAFAESGVQYLIMPSTVKYIGPKAFTNCYSLREINLPEGITAILPATFDRCNMLHSIEIPSSVTTIADEAFIYSGLTTITIPEGVTSIGIESFSGCGGLKEVYLPTSLKTVGRNAFDRSKNVIIFAKEGSVGVYYAKIASLKIEHIND